MKASERLQELKSELESSSTVDRFVSLTNPKNVSLMEALVAWTCIDTHFKRDEDVPQNATMDDMWLLADVDPKEFGDTAGLSIKSGIDKIKQMKNLGLIFPDATALSKAMSLVKIYVKGKIEELIKKTDDDSKE